MDIYIMREFKLGEIESRLVHLIYEAALTPEKWRLVLEKISSHIGANEGSIIFYDAQNRARNFLETAFDDRKIEYLENIIDIEVQGIKNIFKGYQEGAVVNAANIVHQTGETYEAIQAEAMQFEPRAEFEVKAAIPLIQGSIITSAMGFHRHKGSVDLSIEELNFLQCLAPHLTRAIHIHNHVTAVKQKQHSLIESLKNTNLGIFLLDINLQVIFTTPEATRILNGNAALKVNHSKYLEAYEASEHIHLEKKLRDLAEIGFKSPQLINEGLSFALHHPECAHPLKLSALPITDTTNKSSRVIRLAIFINDPQCPRIIPRQYLQEAYEFTNTETHIAQLILNGYSTAEIAATRNTSLDTARGQLKSIMQKTTTHTQAELMRLLVTLSGDFFGNKVLNQNPD